MPPVGHRDVRPGPERPVRIPASALVRAALLRPPRGEPGIRHRRLVDRHVDGMRASGDGLDDAVAPWNTFRGATARFVAFG